VTAVEPERPVDGRLIDQFEYGLDAPSCLTWELTYACPFAIHENFPAGNVRDEGGFQRVWQQSDPFAELRGPQTGGACTNCAHFHACRGGCMAAKLSAPVMKLVEVVRTVVTEPEVVEDVEAPAERLGKVDVTIGDKAGFITNALLFGYLNHAMSMFEKRYATREDIDAAMRLRAAARAPDDGRIARSQDRSRGPRLPTPLTAAR
jgi:radical SAM protein with 4Fe4S-binding SPASM domain